MARKSIANVFIHEAFLLWRSGAGYGEGQLVLRIVRWVECGRPPRNALVNEQGRLDAICCAEWDMSNWRYLFDPSIQCIGPLDH